MAPQAESSLKIDNFKVIYQISKGVLCSPSSKSCDNNISKTSIRPQYCDRPTRIPVKKSSTCMVRMRQMGEAKAENLSKINTTVADIRPQKRRNESKLSIYSAPVTESKPSSENKRRDVLLKTTANKGTLKLDKRRDLRLKLDQASSIKSAPLVIGSTKSSMRSKRDGSGSRYKLDDQIGTYSASAIESKLEKKLERKSKRNMLNKLQKNCPLPNKTKSNVNELTAKGNHQKGNFKLDSAQQYAKSKKNYPIIENTYKQNCNVDTFMADLLKDERHLTRGALKKESLRSLYFKNIIQINHSYTLPTILETPKHSHTELYANKSQICCEHAKTIGDSIFQPSSSSLDSILRENHDRGEIIRKKSNTTTTTEKSDEEYLIEFRRLSDIDLSGCDSDKKQQTHSNNYLIVNKAHAATTNKLKETISKSYIEQFKKEVKNTHFVLSDQASSSSSSSVINIQELIKGLAESKSVTKTNLQAWNDMTWLTNSEEEFFSTTKKAIYYSIHKHGRDAGINYNTVNNYSMTMLDDKDEIITQDTQDTNSNNDNDVGSVKSEEQSKSKSMSKIKDKEDKATEVALVTHFTNKEDNSTDTNDDRLIEYPIYIDDESNCCNRSVSVEARLRCDTHSDKSVSTIQMIKDEVSETFDLNLHETVQIETETVMTDDKSCDSFESTDRCLECNLIQSKKSEPEFFDANDDNNIMEDLEELEILMDCIRYSCEIAELSTPGKAYNYQVASFKATLQKLHESIINFEEKYQQSAFLLDKIKSEFKLRAQSRIFEVMLHTQDIKFYEAVLNFTKEYTIVQPEVTLPVTDGENEFNITDVRRIGCTSLLIKWKLINGNGDSCMTNVIGFEIHVNGVLKTRIFNASRNVAILDELPLKVNLSIAVHAINEVGACIAKARAHYKML